MRLAIIGSKVLVSEPFKSFMKSVGLECPDDVVEFEIRLTVEFEWIIIDSTSVLQREGSSIYASDEYGKLLKYLGFNRGQKDKFHRLTIRRDDLVEFNTVTVAVRSESND